MVPALSLAEAETFQIQFQRLWMASLYGRHVSLKPEEGMGAVSWQKKTS